MQDNAKDFKIISFSEHKTSVAKLPEEEQEQLKGNESEPLESEVIGISLLGDLYVESNNRQRI